MIDLAREICEKNPEVFIGIGDDAAVVKLGEKDFLAVTTDMLIEDIHFTSKNPPGKLGKKVVVINLSDIAAMGANPMGLVYSLGIPKSKDVEYVSELLKGMNSAAQKYGTSIVGGDLNEGKEIIISGTAFGRSEEDELLLRSGAKPGDIIGITGELGNAAAAVKALTKGIPLEDKGQLEESFLEPTARVKEGRLLSKSGKVTSAIDISDGLATTLWQISRASEVGIVVDFEKIPISEATEAFAKEEDVNLDDLVLFGGEDFELLFTVDSEAWEDLKDSFRKLDTKISKIGKIQSEKGVYLHRGENLEKFPDRGYEHFRK
ncbi:hypothetical protein AKJ37_00080 [candidate division MSBL1 archaeon SCGC-AAA259I09]|uniref:Thiamine-monophosphate kinase n=1 Tax=candidate division MSBL1 archaeon SCGC-AAA259I09 TaxID=1698267 RepID=A0A133UW50_9EURY|nr:hypothetical protein AKJ37_00080 [candidate division MSBL1 archaeon SCGC-AAA259I09]